MKEGTILPLLAREAGLTETAARNGQVAVPEKPVRKTFMARNPLRDDDGEPSPRCESTRSIKGDGDDHAAFKQASKCPPPCKHSAGTRPCALAAGIRFAIASEVSQHRLDLGDP